MLHGRVGRIAWAKIILWIVYIILYYKYVLSAPNPHMNGHSPGGADYIILTCLLEFGAKLWKIALYMYSVRWRCPTRKCTALRPRGGAKRNSPFLHNFEARPLTLIGRTVVVNLVSRLPQFLGSASSAPEWLGSQIGANCQSLLVRWMSLIYFLL